MLKHARRSGMRKRMQKRVEERGNAQRSDGQKRMEPQAETQGGATGRNARRGAAGRNGSSTSFPLALSLSSSLLFFLVSPRAPLSTFPCLSCSFDPLARSLSPHSLSRSLSLY